MSEAKTTRALRELAALAGLVLLITSLTQAVLHLRDLSGIQHISGVWMALAAYLNEGVFYPPLEADGFYAGTRYMPLLFLSIAGLARLGCGYLVSAKLAALLSAGLLLGGLFAAVRRRTGRWTDALALTGLLLAFPEGRMPLLSPHADALPVALALAGLLLLERVQTWRVVAAALLFALAVAAKFSAVAGPAAAAVALWRAGHRRLAILGALLFVGLVGLEVAALQAASDGRFLDNLRSLGSGGMTLASLSIGPSRLGIALFQVSPFLAVWPVALFLLLRAIFTRTAAVWEWYLLAALAATAFIFTSPGTGFNHLLELQVACVLVLAGAVSPAPAGSPRGEAVVLALRGLNLAAVLVGLWSLAGPAEPDSSAITPAALAEGLRAPEKVLSEDASVPVLLGQRPVVMDPFAFRLLAEQDRIDDEALAQRIGRQEFDALVMLARIDRPESLCPHFHFGPRVTEAMRRWYRFEGYVGGYAVFRPVPTALARSSLTQGQVQVQPVRGAPQSCRDTGVAGAGGT
jgi:hypothetical protein